MKIGKLILATVVIYSAGLLTGALLVKFTQPKRAQRPWPEPAYQERFVERMRNELQLSPEQFRKVKTIFSESRQRLQPQWSRMQKDLQTEVHVVRDRIRAELKPEQRQRFEALMKERSRWPELAPMPEHRRLRKPAPSATGTPGTSDKPGSTGSTNQPRR